MCPRAVPNEVVDKVGCSHKAGKVIEDQRFCFHCGSTNLDPGEMLFTCRDCKSSGPRAYTFRKEARFEIVAGQLKHFSVGAAVFCRFGEELEDRLLLLRRATHPVGAFTIPSGHWDLSDQKPRSAAEREVVEETGLLATALGEWRLVSAANEELFEGCRRGSDVHCWHFYSCRCHPSEAVLRLQPDVERGVIGESDLVGWFPISQVCGGRFLLTRPAAYFLGKILEFDVQRALIR